MNQPFRTSAAFAGRCGRGHMHAVKAVGGYCTIAPCRSIAERGAWEPERRIERVEVAPGSVWPNAQHEFVLDHLNAELDKLPRAGGA